MSVRKRKSVQLQGLSTVCCHLAIPDRTNDQQQIAGRCDRDARQPRAGYGGGKQMTTDRNIASITADLADEVQEVAKRYPSKRSAIMPALYLAQDKYGNVDDVVYQAIS